LSTQIIIVLVLNFIIAIIGTLAYSVRLVGVRTGKIAITFAVFNILSLVSRTALTFQAPLLTKFVENSTGESDVLNLFKLIIIVSGIATLVGAFLIPTFQRLFYKGVIRFSIDKSIPKLIMHSFSKAGVHYMRDCISIPVKESVTKINFKKLPLKIIIYNIIAVAILTVGALAPIYAGTIVPDVYFYRSTTIHYDR